MLDREGRKKRQLETVRKLLGGEEERKGRCGWAGGDK